MLRHGVVVGGKEMLENLGKKCFLLCSRVGKLFFRLFWGRVAWCMLHGPVKASQDKLGFWLGVVAGSISHRVRGTLKRPHK